MFNVDNEYDIPRDVINNECLCQITGRREVIVENYKRIKIYYLKKKFSGKDRKKTVQIDAPATFIIA